MYAHHFRLNCLPFEDRPDLQFFYSTPDREEALAAMECQTRHGAGMALILGEAGTGKTLLARGLLRRLQENQRAAVITCPANGAVELLRECCRSLGVTLPNSTTAANLLSKLRRHLRRCAEAGSRTVLIIDQAENIAPAGLADLATLADVRCEPDTMLTILLLAQPQFRSLLDSAELARLKQDLYGERMILPLSAEGTREYIECRLRAAGAANPGLIDSGAVQAIHQHAGGIPRLINRICDAAMLAAYGAGQDEVSREVVDEIVRPVHHAKNMSAADLGLRAAPMTFPSPDGFAAAAARFPGHPSEPQISPSRAPNSPCHDPEPGAKSVEAVTQDVYRIHETLTDLLRETVQSADRIHQRIVERLSEADRRVSGFESRIARAETAASEIERQADRAERACERGEHIAGQLSTFADQVADKADELQSRIDSLLGSVSAAQGVEARLREHTSLASAAATDLPHRAQSLQAELRKVVESEAARAKELICNQMQTHAAAAADEAIRSADRRIELLRTEVANLDERGNRTLESIHSASRELDAASNRVAEIRAQTDDGLQQAKAAQAQVASALLDIGAGCERVQTARKAAEECRDIAERARFEREATTKALTQIAECAGAADQIKTALDQTVQRANGCLDNLQLHSEAAATLADELGERSAHGQEVLSQATSAQDALTSAAEHSVRQASDLSIIQEAGALLIEHLRTDMDTAGEMRQAVECMIAHADDRLARLGEHSAAARLTVEQTDRANAAARRTIEQLDALRGRTEESAATAYTAAERIASKISTTLAEAQAVQNSVAEQVASASGTAAALQTTIGVGSELAANLQTRIEHAMESADSLQRGCNRAVQTVDESIQAAGDAIARAQESIDAVVARAAEERGHLARCTDQANAACRFLDELLGTARDLSRSQQTIAAETERTVRNVSQQLAELQGAEAHLSEIPGRIAAVRDEVGRIEGESGRLAEKLNALGEEPKQTLAAARDQTAELERVLAAVRKIFAGLSQSSLEAKQQSDDLDAKAQTAAERLARLTAHTNQATRTLSQWVKEALRVQSRLDQTLREAPWIDQTHPIEQLGDMMEALGGENGNGGPADRSPGRAGPIRRMPARAVPTRESVPADRGEEIAQILEEAGRAEAP